MELTAFEQFRNDVLISFDKFSVPYKLFGGAAVQLIQPTRSTEDVDIFIQKNNEHLNLVFLALEDCGFDTIESLHDQFFGEGESLDTPIDDLEYKTVSLYSSKEDWQDFHIDLSFELFGFTYSNTPEEVVDTGSLSIHTVSYFGLLDMKRNIRSFVTGEPEPREKDIQDLGILRNHLGLDADIEKPIESKKKRWWQR